MVTPAEAAILNRIDRDQLLADLSALIRIRSLGGHETPAQEWMAARLRSLGLAVDDWTIDIDRLRGHPACSMEVARDRGLGVAGTLGDGPVGRQVA